MMNRTADVKPNKETILSLIYAGSGIGFPSLGALIHGYLTVHFVGGVGEGEHVKIPKPNSCKQVTKTLAKPLPVLPSSSRFPKSN